MGSATVTGNLDVNGTVLMGYERVPCPGKQTCPCPSGKKALGGTAIATLNPSEFGTRWLVADGFLDDTTYFAYCTGGTCASLTVVCARVGL